MLATLAILGCVIASVVCAAVVVGAAIVGGGISIHNAKEAEALQREQMGLAADAEDKAEDRAEADQVIQARMAERNLLKARQSLGTSIAFTNLQTKRKVRENAKLRHENGYSSNGTVPSPT